MLFKKFFTFIAFLRNLISADFSDLIPKGGLVITISNFFSKVFGIRSTSILIILIFSSSKYSIFSWAISNASGSISTIVTCLNLFLKIKFKDYRYQYIIT